MSGWKKQLLEEGATVFGSHTARREREQATREAELYEQIGRLKMELEWLEKKLSISVETKRAMIDLHHPDLSIRRQCELVGLNRATFYWEPAGESEQNLALMRLIDPQFTRTPFCGYRQMTVYLRKQEDQEVNPKRVARLMRKWPASHLPATRDLCSGSRAPEIPVPAAGVEDRPAQSGMVGEYHLRAAVAGLRLLF